MIRSNDDAAHYGGETIIALATMPVLAALGCHVAMAGAYEFRIVTGHPCQLKWTFYE